MLIPTAAIWRHASCCLHSVPPNPTIPITLSSLPVSRWERHTPAATCAAVFMLWMFACAHRGACCASVFTARISDKLNESPESSYLPAHSCSVLSSLFSDSVFAFLFSFFTFSPLAVYLLISTLPLSARWVFASISEQAVFVCSGYTSPLAPKANSLKQTLLFIMWIRWTTLRTIAID